MPLLEVPNKRLLCLCCRYEFTIATVPPVLAPILAAVFVNYRGRKAGIMLGCVLMMIGQVRVWEQHDRIGLVSRIEAASTALHRPWCSFLQGSIELPCAEAAGKRPAA